MEVKPFKIVLLFLFTTMLAACGGGGGADQPKTQGVKITVALRCAIDVGGNPQPLPIPIPDDCAAEQIDGDRYETDQNAIYLSGVSFKPKSDNCSNPPLTLGGPICIPSVPGDYSVTWTNLTNGESSTGSRQYIGFGLHEGLVVRWNTHNARNVSAGLLAYPTGIPLEIGPNTIRVSAAHLGISGNAEIIITRVVDVVPPNVLSVNPEPGGTYDFRIVVQFSELLDPASTAAALLVADDNGQPAPGMSEFDSLKLAVVWRPQPVLNPDTTYTARVSGVTDLSGNVMITPYEWLFVTRP